jgi:hypothetical protein
MKSWAIHHQRTTAAVISMKRNINNNNIMMIIDFARTKIIYFYKLRVKLLQDD